MLETDCGLCHRYGPGLGAHRPCCLNLASRSWNVRRRNSIFSPSLGACGFTLVAPVLVIGILTGLTGRSPGKFIMFLNVKDAGGDPPGIATRHSPRDYQGRVARVLLRHDLGTARHRDSAGKPFTISGSNLDVEDLKPIGLTETQKNWRKYHRDLARKNRK